MSHATVVAPFFTVLITDWDSMGERHFPPTMPSRLIGLSYTFPILSKSVDDISSSNSFRYLISSHLDHHYQQPSVDIDFYHPMPQCTFLRFSSAPWAFETNDKNLAWAPWKKRRVSSFWTLTMTMGAISLIWRVASECCIAKKIWYVQSCNLTAMELQPRRNVWGIHRWMSWGLSN